MGEYEYNPTNREKSRRTVNGKTAWKSNEIS